MLPPRFAIGQHHPASGPGSPIEQEGWARATFPLGAHFQGAGVSFAVFSRRATRVVLELYDAAFGADAAADYVMQKNPDDHVWRAHVAGIREGALYAFRCWGPNWDYDPRFVRGGSSLGFSSDVDADGNRFNPNKVLFDPYARELTHDPVSPALVAAGLDERVFASGPRLYRGAPCREHDSGRWASKGVVLREESRPLARPLLPAENAVIYEAHLRGSTRHPSAARLSEILSGIPGFEHVESVPDALRGTYAGAAHLATYLRAFGFTTIELMPVQETQNDDNPDDRPGGNFWGYMTNAYFAPDRRYAFDKSPGGPTREFKAMIDAFHAAGLEVYLDVVYNHSGEGGNWVERGEDGRAVRQRDVTSFVSLGGFDAAEYYQRTPDNLLDDGATGCGNQIDYSSPVCQALVLDSLGYWIQVMGVDGFRFDLAPVLGRLPSPALHGQPEQRRFHADHPLLTRVRDLGLKYDVEMIAEAWDLWGYEVGNFPTHWGEWNGRYRDTVRRFIKGSGSALDLADMMNGDFHHFQRHGGAQRSVNFIVAHDGFTLMDLVSYAKKTNDACRWPFGPTDGGLDENDSWHWQGNHAVRRQQLRNLWTILFFSRGVPMVLYGDELGRTQNGNNNPWNVDSVATWTDYDMIATNHPHAQPTGGAPYHDNFGVANCRRDKNPLFVFASYLARLRRTSLALKQRRYGDFELGDRDDVTYLFRREDGVSPLGHDNRCVWLRIDGSGAGDGDFLLMLNLHTELVRFTIPNPYAGSRWVRIVDTAGWAEPEMNCWPLARAKEVDSQYGVHPFSIVALKEVPDHVIRGVPI